MAISDPDGILASPLIIIDRTEDESAVITITGIVKQYQVAQIIAGLPRSMDGSIGRQAEKVQTFVENLRKHTNVPVDFRDERLSTVSAKRLMRDVRKMGKGSKHDAIAAALILQSYLDEEQQVS